MQAPCAKRARVHTYAYAQSASDPAGYSARLRKLYATRTYAYMYMRAQVCARAMIRQLLRLNVINAVTKHCTVAFNFKATCSMDTWALVKWLEQDSLSIIPTTWILEHNPLPALLPFEGKCYWKRKTSRYDVIVYAFSGKFV